MFGKKKESGFSAIHYEGIDHFATDCPVRLEVKGDIFEIKRMKPETIVTLPLNRIKSFSVMSESSFMEQYHGIVTTTSKKSDIARCYLVVKYDKGQLVFWGTIFDLKHFEKLQHTLVEVPRNIEL